MPLLLYSIGGKTLLYSDFPFCYVFCVSQQLIYYDIMFDFLTNFYEDSLLLGWAFLIFFGLYLLLGKVIEEEQMKNYRRARQRLGLGIFVWGMQVLLHWIFGFRESAPTIAAAVNLTFYYFCAILFGQSFTLLLDHSSLGSKRLLIDRLKILLFAAVVWGAVLLLPASVSRYVSYVGAIYFFIDLLMLYIRYRKTFNKAKKQSDDYYTEGIHSFVSWLNKSTYFMIAAGLAGAFMLFAPLWLVTLYMCAGIGVFIYVFVSFQNYTTHYRYVEAAVVEVEGTEELIKDTVLVKASMVALQQSVATWIEEKGYTEKEINIESLARHFSTNRTYLSLYIKDTYDCNFRQFVSQLRIKEAKRMLTESDISISEISFQVGFSTPSHFSRTFRQMEGITPQEVERKTNG